ncbi:aminopeptidase [Haladaptatus sp. NG-WS-4]
MTNSEDTTNGQTEYRDDVDPDELIDDATLQPTPKQHEQLKNGLHGDRLKELKRADRRYLVIGRGGDDGPGKRRKRVCNLLSDRLDATAFRLEDFGFSGDELDLWAPAFDILSEMASYIVGILEDYDGGHVWELGFLYHYQTRVRNILWLLKRIYATDEEMRNHYDNGIAASHLAVLEEAAADRVIPWEDPTDLPNAVDQLP